MYLKSPRRRREKRNSKCNTKRNTKSNTKRNTKSNTKGILKRVLKAKLKEKSLGVQNHYVLCEKFSTITKTNNKFQKPAARTLRECSRAPGRGATKFLVAKMTALFKKSTKSKTKGKKLRSAKPLRFM